MVFFTNFGVAYTCRIVDVPASTGYGEPVQKLFKFKDGERVIAAFSLDPRVSGDIGRVAEDAKPATGEPEPPPVHAMAVTSDGYSLRFSLAGFVEPSTRSGRRYARVPDGAEVVSVSTTTGEETVIAATREARAMLCPVEEVNFLSGPGRGVILIKLDDDDRVIGAIVSTRRSRSDDGGDLARRGADDQHRQVRSDRPRRQGPRADAARRSSCGCCRRTWRCRCSRGTIELLDRRRSAPSRD